MNWSNAFAVSVPVFEPVCCACLPVSVSVAITTAFTSPSPSCFLILPPQVALVQFINIAFTELLSSGRVDAVVKVLKGTPFEGLFLSGTFTDLGRDWYAEVGIAMHLTLLLCVVKSLVRGGDGQ